MNEWLGREVITEDCIDRWRVQAMHATLDRTDALPTVLPPFWHWIYFHDPLAQRHLGRDGHPAKGHGLTPPDTPPRRMWAGGEVQFLAPLPVGVMARRRSTLRELSEKSGRSGRLVFAVIDHEISAEGQVVLRERQDVVYRDDPGPEERAPVVTPAPTNAEWTRKLQASTTQLFRYSALTFNGHRIHYDVEYARQVEGYPGLIVHGPLLATQILELARDHLKLPLRSFTFRAMTPVFQHQTYSVHGRRTETGAHLWVAGHDGRLCMTGAVTV